MTIRIEELSFSAILGILPQERQIPQRLRIDCTIDYPYAEGSFINYAEVAALIESTMITEKFELIETAITTLASVLTNAFPQIRSLRLSIRKPDILPNCTVGVEHLFTYGD